MPAGITMPPPSPWRMRNAMSEWASQARPQSAEPSTNSATEDIHSRLVPKRSAAQPVSGITLASASM